MKPLVEYLTNVFKTSAWQADVLGMFFGAADDSWFGVGRRTFYLLVFVFGITALSTSGDTRFAANLLAAAERWRAQSTQSKA